MPNIIRPGSGPGRGKFWRSRALGDSTGPQVQNVTPNSDQLVGGSTVTITGQRFRTSSTGIPPVVMFGTEIAYSVIVVNDRTITVTVPSAAAAGLVDVSVSINGQTDTLSQVFGYFQTTLVSASPSFGLFGGGQSILIAGYNFAAGSTIQFGNVPATNVIFLDDQHYACTTPAHAAGVVDIVLTNATGNTITLRNGFTFTLLTRGNDIRRKPGLTIRDILNNAPNACNFTVDGSSNAPVCGEEIRIYDDSALIFAGNVQTVEQKYEGLTDQLAWACTSIDFSGLLNRRRPFGVYTNTSASDIAIDLITRFAPGFTSTFVQTGLAKVTISFDGTQDFRTCLSNLAKSIGGGHWYVDYNRSLHFFHTKSNIVIPTQPQSKISLGPGTAMTAAESGSTASGVNFAPGYYVFRSTFIYSNGIESAFSPISNPVLLYGDRPPLLTGIPIGPPVGTLTVVGRRLYYYAYTSAATDPKWTPFVQINDNATTALTRTFGDFATVPTPTKALDASIASGGAVDLGAHSWAFTRVTIFGEGLPSPLVSGTALPLQDLGYYAPDVPPVIGAPVENGVYMYGGHLARGGYKWAVTFSGSTKSETLPGALLVVDPFTTADVFYAMGYTNFGISQDLILPAAPLGYTTINLYRTAAGGTQLKFVASYPMYQKIVIDGIADSALGANAPTVVALRPHIVPAQQTFVLSGFSNTGAANDPTLSFNLYRTPIGSAQLKLVSNVPLGQNFYQDSIADAALGVNAPTVDTANTNFASFSSTKTAPYIANPTGSAYQLTGNQSTSYANVPTARNQAPYLIGGTQTFTAGYFALKVTNVYQDGTESLPTPASDPVSLDGLHQILVSNLQPGAAINGVPVAYRKIYYSIYIPTPSPGVPSWTPSTTNLMIIVPDNTSSSVLANPSIFTGSIPESLLSSTLVWPNPDGPSLELFDPPDDIDANNTTLIRDVQFTSVTDHTQTRNRVHVYGVSVTITTAAVVGDVSIQISDASPFSANGGSFGALGGLLDYTAAVKRSGVNTLYLASPLTTALPSGTLITSYLRCDDVRSQNALGKIELDTDGNPTDGIHETVIVDTSLVLNDQLFMRGQAELELFAYPITTINGATRDPNMRSGAIVHVDMTDPPCIGDFLIQEVTIDQYHDESDELVPRYTFTGCSVRYELDDLILDLASGIGSGSSGISSGVSLAGITPASSVSTVTFTRAAYAMTTQGPVINGVGCTAGIVGSGATQSHDTTQVAPMKDGLGTLGRSDWTTLLTSTTADQSAAMRMSAVPTLFIEDNYDMTFHIKTPDDMTNLMMWVGMLNGGGMPPNLVPINQPALALRYANFPGSGNQDSGWTIFSLAAGAGHASTKKFHSSIAPSTEYVIRMQTSVLNSDYTTSVVTFTVNGKAVTLTFAETQNSAAAIDYNLPTALQGASTMLPACGVVNKSVSGGAGTARKFNFRRWSGYTS